MTENLAQHNAVLLKTNNVLENLEFQESLPGEILETGEDVMDKDEQNLGKELPSQVFYADEVANDVSMPSTSDISHHGVTAEQLLEEPNSILITQEDLYEAGFDPENIEHLTDEQLTVLIAIHEQRVAKQLEINNDHGAANGVSAPEIREEAIIHEGFVQQELLPADSSLTIMITGEGGLKLSDTSGQVFYFSPSQLAEMEIDVNNLTDDSIQHVVQMAMPPTTSKTRGEKPNIMEDYQEATSSHPTSSYAVQKGRVMQVGEEVSVRDTRGDVQPAIVRYIRNEGSYKVQLEDGTFQWVNEGQLVSRKRNTDHEDYSQQPKSRVLFTQKRRHPEVDCDESSGAPFLKRYQPNEPNFCCPVCDKKVYQKEPAYIVIRLPACDSCTKEKIIVLDSEYQQQQQSR
ncbi:unnamed protein product [Caenorhabditis auriculariae]|uniref:Uncharacterized protein n=1 Tax=Caenorhabditis auriculariae TaxID=2777116 RepID=A0A8S1HKN4_9PELO|nr:unnamed protein product [Caenorhabditis auriculariae]